MDMNGRLISNIKNKPLIYATLWLNPQNHAEQKKTDTNSTHSYSVPEQAKPVSDIRKRTMTGYLGPDEQGTQENFQV